MNVLLSIKPKYVEAIKKGTKKYEFRKSIWAEKNRGKVEKVFIYASSPVKKIVARFRPESLHEDHPKKLWKNCKEFSGIDETAFFRYFREKERGFALKISDLKVYDEPIDPHRVLPDFHAPQSFCYVEDLEKRQEITSFF